MKIRYFVSYYNDPVPARDFELSQVRDVHEQQVRGGYLHEVIDVQPRPTFKDMFAKVQEIATPEDISIIMNSDCYMSNAALIKLREFNFEKGRIILALSRYDVREGGELVPHHNPDSQDAWICKGHVRELRFSNFFLGENGCDNRIAHELKSVGYLLENRAVEFPVMHVHTSGVRNQKKSNRVPPPYHLLHVIK